MNTVIDHRSKHCLDIPRECLGFHIDDYVQYVKNGQIRQGYIYCFRQFGYDWFAWIYFDKLEIKPIDGTFVCELERIEEE